MISNESLLNHIGVINKVSSDESFARGKCKNMEFASIVKKLRTPDMCRVGSMADSM